MFNLNQPNMFRSYLKIASRQMMKSKSFALINVLGLAVGLTAFVLIIQYVSFELSYDTFHSNANEIFRVAYAQEQTGELKNTSARNFVGITSLVKEHIPEVKAATAFDRTAPYAGFLFGYQGKLLFEPESFYQTDSSFFQVFPSLLVKGNPSFVLKDPHDLVLSEKMARKIFGDEDPIGKKIENRSPSFADAADFVVRGVMKDMPENSHFHANFVALIHQEEVTPDQYWKGPKLYTYLTLSPADAPRVTERLNRLLATFGKEDPSMQGAKAFLQPVSTIHLRSDLNEELEVNGSEVLVYLLSALGVIILLLAWINYVNIETARFIRRTKEVGVRRIIGSGKSDLAWQFLVEYGCTVALAAGLAWTLLLVILPRFTYLTGIPIATFQWSMPWIWLGAFGIFLAGSVIAGIYPAIFILKLNPIATLKGSLGGTNRGSTLRKSLIVVQFTSSLVLLAFILVIHHQLDFMRLTNKKIDLDKVVSLRNPTVYANADDSTNRADYMALKHKLLEHPMVKDMTSSSCIPGMVIDEYFVNRIKRHQTDPDDPTRFKILFVDHNFIPFYDLKLAAGRNYSPEQGDEENWNTVVLNASATRALGFTSPAEAVDQEVDFLLWGGKFEKYKIVGVVEDYHHEAIKKAVEPTILSFNHGRFQDVYYSVKLSAGSDPQEALAYIHDRWKEVFPAKSFDYFFLDEYYDRQFKTERHFARTFGSFAGVAVFIACLGILGLTLFEMNARLKEISIRKVLGATAANLVRLLSKEYFKLVLMATLISAPVVYYSASEWLKNYPVRIEISGWFFVWPLIVMVVLVSIASGLQTIKAASTNPVDHLKGE